MPPPALLLLFFSCVISAQQTVPYNERVDCHPDPNSSQEACEKRKCIWDSTDSYNSSLSVPLCYFPRNTGYTFVNTTRNSTLLQYSTSGAPCPFGEAIQHITFSTSTIGSVLNVKIRGENSSEALVDLPKTPTSSSERFNVNFNIGDTFSFAVRRTSTRTNIWDTSIGGLIVADQFIQIASYLPTMYFYGLGENTHLSLMHDLSVYTTWGMLARDEPPNSAWKDTKNLYGVHPFYMALETDGLAHGVLILNTHAQEITTGPGPHIVYRTIGGMLDIYFFPGPTPEEVVKQYLGIIGTPFLPAYWALGFQLSRYGYNALDNMKTVVERNINANISMDVVQADIDYMEGNMDFTLGESWKGFGGYADELHEMGMHLILMFDPAIDVTSSAFANAFAANVSFIEWESEEKVQHDVQELYPLINSTKIMLGVVWPYHHTAFPDFLDPLNNTANWWTQEFKDFHDKVAFDGIWIDMNEPAAFGTNEEKPWYWSPAKNITPLWCFKENDTNISSYDKPPYETVSAYIFGGILASKTVCMSGLTARGTRRVYETKNIYGLSEVIITQKVLHEVTGKRGAVISRSTFPSAGHYGGHWLGDNSANWNDLKTAIIGVQEFNMFGIPYVGSDICGFNGNTTEELCLRWHQVGAFHPFSRNHNAINQAPQDPAQWDSVATATRVVNRFRYHYLPYLYSLHFDAAIHGGTVVRPLFFEFPHDSSTYNLGMQFMWGSGLMFVPVTDEGKTAVTAHFPRPAVWYGLMDWSYGVARPSNETEIELSAWPSGLFPIFARGGVIMPRQEPAQTTTQSRQLPLEILIPIDLNGEASGQLYWDDGESIVSDFETYNYYHFIFRAVETPAMTTITVERKRNAENITIPSLDVIEIFGLKHIPVLTTAKLNGKWIGNKLQTDLFQYRSDIGYLLIHQRGFLFLNATADTNTITWENEPVPSAEDIVPKDERVDCMPDKTMALITDEDECQLRGCIFSYNVWDTSTPRCFFRKSTGYYANDTSGDVVELKKGPNSGACPFGQDFEILKFSILSGSPRLHIRIGDSSRFTPDILPQSQAPASTEALTVEKTQETGVFSFIVRRQSTKQIIWDTSIGGLVFSDQYVQIAAYIGDAMIYGLGESAHQTLVHDNNRYTTWALLARDEPPNSIPINGYLPDTKNLYGIHVFYVGMEGTGLAHGVFILNSNPQEITVGPAPHIVYRTIGGLLDIYFFPGPLPEDVVHQYLGLVGTPLLPSYWSLGFQLSRYGYSSLQEMEDTVAAVQAAGIPLDVPYADIDYMDECQDFTISGNFTGFGAYVDKLHNATLHVIVMLDPAITASGDPFRRGIKNYSARFLEWERMDQVQREIQDEYELANDTKIMLGVVWPNRHVAFPDFSSTSTATWWKHEIEEFHKQVAFDGLWIDMNEPAAFGTNEDYPFYFDLPYHSNITSIKCPTEGDDAKYDIPPFETHSVYRYRADGSKSYLASKTVCMLAVTHDGKRMYDVKNLYGLHEAIVTYEALAEILRKRPVIISRSTFPTSGHYTGHWLGDNYATWDDLRTSIIGIQEFNMFGIPYVGADICGFNGNTTEELCLRWQQLGAFYPFSRNHNDKAATPQHPALWPSVAAAARKSNLFRYYYLPYLYTLHFEASRDGRTVVRPVFFEFPQDDAARQLNHQFMWGSAIMIVGVTKPGVTSVQGYLPRTADWYSLRDSDYGVRQKIGFQDYSAAWDDILPVFIRAGTIVPRQAAEVTTVLSRKNPIELLIANDNINGAKGTFVFDDGESIIGNYSSYPHYAAEISFKIDALQSTLLISRTSNSTDGVSMPTLDVIEVFGHEGIPLFSTFTGCDGQVDLSSSSYDVNSKRLLIKGTGLVNLLRARDIQITWKNMRTSSYVSPKERVDCHPKPNATYAVCEASKCIWDPVNYEDFPDAPMCYFPPGVGYRIVNVVTDGKEYILESTDSIINPYGTDLPSLYYTIGNYGPTVNVRIGASGRYEPPITLPRESYAAQETLTVESPHVGETFHFLVRRNSTDTVIWDSSIGPLLFADQYIQIATRLPSDKVYGLGENAHQTLKHNFSRYITWAMLARDEQPNSVTEDTKNLYGVYAFYICVENDTKAHGVFILNSNPQDVTTAPGPHLIYRTIGGMLDIYFFPGPTAEDVVHQYLRLVGFPVLPSYWSFGYQLCRYGYESFEEMTSVIQSVRDAGIPIDIPYGDIDYMNRYTDFSIGEGWKEFPNFTEQMHAEGLHVFLIFDAAIQVDTEPYHRALEQNAAFLEWERYDQVQNEVQGLYEETRFSKVMLGAVWPDRHCAFPDFMDPTDRTKNWWINEFVLFHKQLKFDGIWIDMNEPAVFGTNEDYPFYFDNPDHPNITSLKCPLAGSDSKYDSPPYKTHSAYRYENGELSTKTACMCAVTARGTRRLYDTKNLYGLTQSIATASALEAATGKRGAVIARSTFPSSGNYTGHWSGDNKSTWPDLRTAVIVVQEFNMFGIPYVGTDICGFVGDTTEELCLRWHQLGAFHPFNRNQNDKGSAPQHPSRWPMVAYAARQANLFRYYYLPYLYTLHFKATLQGRTVIRPVFFEFPEDPNTYELSYQFMWGSGMMIIPVVTEGAITVTGYLPVNAKWYSLRDSDYGRQPTSNEFAAPLNDLIPVFARGGVIMPRQAPEVTTTKARNNPFELLIPLDKDYKATGEFYWDDGETLLRNETYYHWTFEFSMTPESAMLTVRKESTGSLSPIPTLDVIDVLGYPYYPVFDSVRLDANPLYLDLTTSYYYEYSKVLSLRGDHLINIEMNASSYYQVTWNHRRTPPPSPTYPTSRPQSTVSSPVTQLPPETTTTTTTTTRTTTPITTTTTTATTTTTTTRAPVVTVSASTDTAITTAADESTTTTSRSARRHADCFLTLAVLIALPLLVNCL